MALDHVSGRLDRVEGRVGALESLLRREGAQRESEMSLVAPLQAAGSASGRLDRMEERVGTLESLARGGLGGADEMSAPPSPSDSLVI